MEVNPQFVGGVQRLGLTTAFFEFLSLEHPNNNVHNIRLCRQLVAAGCLTSAQLVELDVAEQVGRAGGWWLCVCVGGGWGIGDGRGFVRCAWASMVCGRGLGKVCIVTTPVPLVACRPPAVCVP